MRLMPVQGMYFSNAVRQCCYNRIAESNTMIMNNNISLLFSLTALLSGFLMAGVTQADVTGVALTREAQAAITPAKAVEMLKQGRAITHHETRVMQNLCRRWQR